MRVELICGDALLVTNCSDQLRSRTAIKNRNQTLQSRAAVTNCDENRIPAEFPQINKPVSHPRQPVKISPDPTLALEPRQWRNCLPRCVPWHSRSCPSSVQISPDRPNWATSGNPNPISDYSD